MEYYEAISELEEYGALLCNLTRALLSDAGIQIHSITYRVKDYESAIRKLNLKADRYDSVAELTDLLGVRIVTYFSSDVDKVAEVIQREFEIDTGNSVDKRESLHPNEFGYLSLHFVASLSDKRSKFIEYKHYKKMCFELQIRSILQHAWAEIEHDLGYKAKAGLPDAVSRRFFRLAGALELADEEFERLRADISKYEDMVDQEIKTSPTTLPINQSTIVSSLENEPYLNTLDRLVAKARGSVVAKTIDTSYVAHEASSLKILGVENIDQLHKYAARYENYVGLFADLWYTRSGQKNIVERPAPRGIGLFYLAYVLAAQMTDEQLQLWGKNIVGREGKLLAQVRSTWEEVVNQLGVPGKQLMPRQRRKDL